MDVENAEDEERPAAQLPEGAVRGGAPLAESELDQALVRRLDRIVVLAGRRAEPAQHGELLDELRGLVRAAEQLRSPPTEAEKEVVERPARRLHGT
jgi:hypothetical protein